ncbi:MAG: hypothetical protein ACXW27_10350 [Allosphingosinicella sp.]
MSEQQERKVDAEAARRKAEWTRPEVDRLVAGGAEGSSDISTDGVDIPS